MRESPSGQANPNGTVFFDAVTIPAGSSAGLLANCPGAKVGDAVAYSVDSGGIGPLLLQFAITSANGVIVNLFNYSANPYTVNGVTVYVEVLPRG